MIPSLCSDIGMETTRYSGAFVSHTSLGSEPTIKESMSKEKKKVLSYTSAIKINLKP